MKFSEVVNKQILEKTGFDVPELDGQENLTRKEVLTYVKKQLRWWDDYAEEQKTKIENVIREHFTFDELTD